MKKICATILSATAGLVLLTSQSLATTTNLGTLPAGSTDDVVPFTDIIAKGATTFSDSWTFTVASEEEIVATISAQVVGTQAGASGTFELIGPTGVVLISDSITSAMQFFGAGLGEIELTPGTYTLDYVGTLTAQSGPTTLAGAITVSAVPEISTWLMLLAGFAGLGFLAYRRSSNEMAASA